MNLTCIHGMPLEVFCYACPGTGRRTLMNGGTVDVVAPISDGEWHDGKIGDIIEPNVGFQEIADELARGDRAAALVKDAVTVSLIRSGRPETIPHTLNLSLRLGDDDANFMLRFIGGQR